MKMKTMVIGLGPEYNYDVTNHEIWKNDNTKYASNHGASFISRTLIDFFDADFIDDLSKVDEYKNEYDLCVISFATHVTDWRDVSNITSFVKKLQIKTVAFSLGIQDYSDSSSQVNTIHNSLKELLDYVIDSSGSIGVRGPHTASVLVKSGYKPENVITIGCPTIFSPLNRDLKIIKKNGFKNPLIVFHRTMADLNKELISGAPILGQDYLDEVVFRDDVSDDHSLRLQELNKYKKHINGNFTLGKIRDNGIFYRTFDQWFQEVKKHDFVVGARLHGCLAALSQGIPAVMLARDIRVQEIAEFYKIPYIKYEDIGEMSIEDIYNNADFSKFNDLYPHRYDNFIKLMDDLGVTKKLSFTADIPKDYWFSKEDKDASLSLMFKEIAEISMRLELLEKQTNRKIKQTEKRVDKLISTIKRLPGFNTLKGLLK